ncbi:MULTISPECIES: flagellar hook assembly protein FlgD [unclassified Acidovorax]|uniref:flagellar hook assembly protein FlgD n=1 Tax=unclassified Acidovorax TaxID=2684926 RepID=UPI000B406EE9|nr:MULTISPECIES: flagellar hook capping FlgD N-terminal domain-containing protein [unclassified Acidovorax]RDD91878.1 flagellar hook assembly protein FlgD [Acidovorax sp. BoFeN1]
MITSTTSATSATSGSSALGTTATPTDAATDPAAAQDRFLKLLVAQLNNQDPMNPMDNAQMTSQIAQINTVTGIQQLNDTVAGLVNQFSAQQMLQGSAMVGRQVLAQGDTLSVDSESGQATGAFDLAGSAASVKIQVLDAAGKEVGTVDMGALPAGRFNFAWDASAYQGDSAPRFKVLAANGETNVASTALMMDKVTAVSMDSGSLQLQLSRGGTTTQAGIKAIL